MWVSQTKFAEPVWQASPTLYLLNPEASWNLHESSELDVTD